MKVMTATRGSRFYTVTAMLLGLATAGFGAFFLYSFPYQDVSEQAFYIYLIGWGVSYFLSGVGLGSYLKFRGKTGKRILICLFVLSVASMGGAALYAHFNAAGSSAKLLLPTACGVIFYETLPLFMVFRRLERNDDTPLMADSANIWKNLTWKDCLIIFVIIVAICLLLQVFGIPLDRFFPGTHRRSAATRYETSTKTYKGPEVKTPNLDFLNDQLDDSNGS